MEVYTAASTELFYSGQHINICLYFEKSNLQRLLITFIWPAWYWRYSGSYLILWNRSLVALLVTDALSLIFTEMFCTNCIYMYILSVYIVDYLWPLTGWCGGVCSCIRGRGSSFWLCRKGRPRKGGWGTRQRGCRSRGCQHLWRDVVTGHFDLVTSIQLEYFGNMNFIH